MSRISPSASPTSFPSSLSKSQSSLHHLTSNFAVPRSLKSSPDPKLKSLRFSGKKGSRSPIGVRCNSSIWPGGPGSGTIFLGVFFF